MSEQIPVNGPIEIQAICVSADGSSVVYSDPFWAWDQCETCETGRPTSSNGAASMHARWDTSARFSELSVDIVIEQPPSGLATSEITFWAMQCSFFEPSLNRLVAGAHTGLMHNPTYPGSKGLNWGGYDDINGGELNGSPLTGPTVNNNPNTMHFPWMAGRPYRYRVFASPFSNTPRAWRATVTDLTTGTVTVVRDLYAGGAWLAHPTVWTECFANCEWPSSCVTFTNFQGVEHNTGTVLTPDFLTLSYQTCARGGCSNTNTSPVPSGIRQCTNTERLMPHGARIYVDPADQLAVALSSDADEVAPGEQIEWAASISNRGDTTAEGVTLSDVLGVVFSPSGPYRIPPGETITVRGFSGAGPVGRTTNQVTAVSPTTLSAVSQVVSVDVVAPPSPGPCVVVREPDVPAFNPTVTLAPSDNAAAIVASRPPDTHFELTAGTFNFNDVRAKAGMYFRGQGVGTILEGTGRAYAIRAVDTTADNVKIGRIVVRNYGKVRDHRRAEYGAIQALPNDTVNGDYSNYDRPTGWFIHDVVAHDNSTNGIAISDNVTLLRVTSYGHAITGINGDRCVGGRIHDCDVAGNGFAGATGAASNAANVKLTWHNAGIGRTSQRRNNRPISPMTVSSSRLRADRPGTSGVARIGVWFDLDCHLCYVEHCDLSGYQSWGVFWEGCNNGAGRCNTLTNCAGFGPAFNGNFAAGAIGSGESTNILVEENTLVDCDWALMNRLSNRTSDWINPDGSSFVNYAWPTGPRYWITLGSPSPIPRPGDRSNVWTGSNSFRRNRLIRCRRVAINEGTNQNGQVVQGATDLNSIEFSGNDYSLSPEIRFHQASNTALTLAQWRALPQRRDQ